MRWPNVTLFKTSCLLWLSGISNELDYIVVTPNLGALLHLVQIIHDLRTGPLLRADEFADDLASAIDHEGFREPRRAIQSVGLLPGVADGEQIDVVVADELFVRVVVVVLANGKNGYLVAELLL